MIRTTTALTAALATLALTACGAEDTDPQPTGQSVEELAETAEENTIVEEELFEVCDEEGNRYPSEQAAEDAGLSEAEYGATYCEM